MRLLPLCAIGLLHKVDVTSLLILLVVLLTAPTVLGDESCVATPTDTSNGEQVCSAQTKNNDVLDDELVDDTKFTEEEVDGKPVWWDYTIDQLFEDYFDCGSIIYGYENENNHDFDNNFVEDFDDDDQLLDDEYDSSDDEDYEAEYFGDDEEDGDSKDTDDIHDNEESIEEESHTIDHEDPVSEFQLRKLQKQWAMIRENYVKQRAADDAGSSSSNNEVKQGPKITNHVPSAIVVPSRVGDAGPGKGRGMFATQPISKGTLVINLDNGSTGFWKLGHSWREFAVALPREAACNFIEWSWVQTMLPEDENDRDVRNGLTIFIGFDESNLLNAADWDEVEANVRCGRPPEREGGERGPCRFHYYAARDIAAGEELLTDYGEFENLDQSGWTDIGL
mmetsp:Transcript_32079/g.69258  ORF Transcript_32079/g.69258 Transcript_32079/m.69258 type:complete len:393 (-) Transcript_32079:328-1506(-)